jgi:hypothetical protein
MQITSYHLLIPVENCPARAPLLLARSAARRQSDLFAVRDNTHPPESNVNHSTNVLEHNPDYVHASPMPFGCLPACVSKALDNARSSPCARSMS